MYGKYGLLERSIRVCVGYDRPDGSQDCDWMPVFTVGRVQLCEFFGLDGHERSRDINFHSTIDYSDLPNARYALISLCGEWSDGYIENSRMVGLYDVFETFEQVVDHASSLLELDARNASKFPKSHLVYHYEIWQICDDHDLWCEWDVDSAIYWNGECYDNWLAEVSDGPHSYPTVVHKPVLMSEDYLSSLKTANASRLEQDNRCAACREPLTDSYTFHVDGKPVCYDCWRLHTWYGARIFNREFMETQAPIPGYIPDTSMWNLED